MENDDNKIMAKKNPWLGLQSYSEEETIYGRDNDIQELTQCVLGDKETLLYGKSGIGKSSILNAGVIPTSIRKGFLTVPVRLDHKKDKSYLSQISAEIAFQMAKRYGDTNAKGIVEVLKPKREEEEESFYEYFHRHKFLHPSGERVKLLIILDQFEEIFTLQDKEPIKKRFFAEMADFLNDIMPEYLSEEEEIVEPGNQKAIELKNDQDLDDIFGDVQLSTEQHAPKFVTDNDIHIVFTIREDFLSEFEYYTATIPALKHNRYGLRPLNEEQAAQIILNPVPGLVSLSVAKLIIEKVTNKKDFDINGVPEIEVDSAVLSLYMNRLYDAKIGDMITTELVEEKGSGIIKQFYYSVIETIDPQKVEFLEERLLNSQNRRENITEFNVLHDGKFTKKELNDLCEGDKKILRKFYLSGDMRIEFIHDILCPVIKQHKEERIKLQQEEEERIRQEVEKQRFIAAEKAKREKIEREARLEQERLKEEANLIRKNNRKKFAILGSTIMVILLSFAVWFLGWRVTYKQDYVNFKIVNGYPQGIGKPVGKRIEIRAKKKYKSSASLPQDNNCTVLYRLTRRGLQNKWGEHPFKNVEVITPDGEKACNIFREELVVGLMESELNDKQAQAFAKLQKQTSSWLFSPNICIAKDINDNVLYSIQYYKDNTLSSKDSTKYTQWAIFYDPNGKPLEVSGNGTDRIRQTVQNGIVTGCMFYSELGVPQQNAYGAYGYAFDMDSVTHLCNKRYEVNKFGNKIDSTAIELYYDEYERICKSSVFSVLYPQKNMRVFQFGHFNDTLTFHPNGTIQYGTFHTPGGIYSLIKFKYDENNRPLENKKYIGDSLVEYTKYTYADDGKYDSIVYYQEGDAFVERYNYSNDGKTEEISLWKNGVKYEKNREINEYGDCIKYHLYRKTIHEDSVYMTTTEEYLDNSGQLAKGNWLFSKREIKQDLRNNKFKWDYYYGADEEIVKSTLYEYDEYGREVAQSVAGIDGDPVRCPDWDWSGMCYYKMSVLTKKEVYNICSEGYDEFGDEAYVMKNEELFSLDPMPDMIVSQQKRKNEYDIGIRISKKRLTSLNNAELIKVPFLHLRSKTGQMYTAKPYNSKDSQAIHPKDGDVLYRVGKWRLYQSEADLLQEWKKLSQQGGVIEILRVDGSGYKRYSFTVNAGSLDAKYYTMPIKQSQQNKINNAQL